MMCGCSIFSDAKIDQWIQWRQPSNLFPATFILMVSAGRALPKETTGIPRGTAGSVADQRNKANITIK